MKAVQRRFILQLLGISVVLYGILYLVFTRYVIADVPLLIMIALLFAVNSMAFIMISNTREKKPSSFVYSYMTISFGRMIICAVFVFSYALTHHHDARTFALSFFMLYFIYTIVEVRAIYSFFNAPNP
ncbi:MAG TPA: hypothetical protein VK809_06200 [Bacteroidia bacterium]|nr:hypothetical protein [Bacteroidia bacterium]